MRVLITGAAGLLGGRLAECLSSRFDVVAGYHRAAPPAGLAVARLELTSRSGLRDCLDRVRPQAIVHSAALADADRCERDPAEARAVNAEASQAIARLCQVAGIRMISLSTDLVFDGARGHYREDAPATPSLTYGRTKLAGEEAVLSECPGAAIARVALVVGRGFGPRGSASEAIAWRLAAGQAMGLYTDQYRTPVDADSLSDAVARLVASDLSGRIHLGGSARLSRYELGLRVANTLSLRSGLIEAIRQADARLGVLRPADVSLDSSRAERELGWAPRPLDEAICAGRRDARADALPGQDRR